MAKFVPPSKPVPRVHTVKRPGDVVLGTAATPGHVVERRDWAAGGRRVVLRRVR